MPAPGSAEADAIVKILRLATSWHGIAYPHQLSRSLWEGLCSGLPQGTLWKFLALHAAEFEIVFTPNVGRGFKIRDGPGSAGVSAADLGGDVPQGALLRPAPGPGLATALVAHFQSKGQAGVGGSTPGPRGWDEAAWQAWWDDWQYNHAKGEWQGQTWDSARSAWAGQAWSSRDWGWRHGR